MSEKNGITTDGNISEENQIRFNLMQGWFLRCSWQKKFEYLKGLIDVIQKRDTFPLWCNLLWNNYWDKTFNYSSTLKHFDYPYDRKLNDNNRMLEDEALKKALADDMEWFGNVDKDVQDHVFLTLLLMSGETMIRSLTNYTTKSDLREKKCSMTYAEVFPRDTSTKKTMLDDTLAVGTESHKNVLQKQLEWSTVISDYHLEISNFVKEINNPKKNLTALDYIQILPIYVAKKIFSYLSKETLKQAQKVNSYWEYVANSLHQDYKERANLNNIIKAMEEEYPSLRKIETPQAERIAKPMNNLMKLKYRGSCSKKIQNKTKIKDKPYDGSILQKAVENESQHIKHYIEFVSFPRKQPITDEKYTLLKYPDHINYDGGSMEKDVSNIKSTAGIRVDERVYQMSQMPQPYDPDVEIRPSAGFIIKQQSDIIFD